MTYWLEVFKFQSVEQTTCDRLECTATHQVYPLIREKAITEMYYVKKGQKRENAPGLSRKCGCWFGAAADFFSKAAKKYVVLEPKKAFTS